MKNPTARLAIYVLAILALAFISYSNSFKADFQFDDARQIVSNHYIRSLKNLPRFFTEAKTASYDPKFNGYRPLTIASHAICYAVSGGRPWSFHVLNFTLHVLNALLLMLILGKVLRQSGYARYEMAAFLAAAVFAIHPLQTSTVTYISGRALLLASLFWMLSFYAFLRCRESSRITAAAWGAASLAFYSAGLLSKEMAVSLPAVVILYWLIFRDKNKPDCDRLNWPLFAGYAAVFAAFMVIKQVTQGSVVGQAMPYTVPVNLMSQ
ncbi:MAG TPA: hypothetical protein VGK71_11025, partial [Nitrospirota bacterium]